MKFSKRAADNVCVEVRVCFCVFITLWGPYLETYIKGHHKVNCLFQGSRFDFKFRIEIRLRSDVRVSTVVRQLAVMVTVRAVAPI